MMEALPKNRQRLLKHPKAMAEMMMALEALPKNRQRLLKPNFSTCVEIDSSRSSTQESPEITETLTCMAMSVMACQEALPKNRQRLLKHSIASNQRSLNCEALPKNRQRLLKL